MSIPAPSSAGAFRDGHAAQPAGPAAAARDPAAASARRVELRDRLSVSVILIPLAFMVVEAGGLLYLLAVLVVFALAASEFSRLFASIGLRPARSLLIAGVLLLIAAEYRPVFSLGGALPAALILLALTWHLVDYERGAPASGTDFAVTLAGLFYLGWLGRYFVALRAEPDGLWWLLTVLPAVWLSDTGAYTFGRLFGRRRLAPRLSPRKTWEGYFGSVLFGTLAGALLGLAWRLGAGPASLLSWKTGAVVGLLVGALAPIGDLGISMFKRQVGAKDTGAVIAGHGGALDRIDSWLVGVPIGYYFVQLLAALK